MAKVTFEKVNITYPGASAPTVRDLDLDIADGEFLVLVGPSGCGKSTTLRALAGLEPTSSGRITIDGKDVTNLEPGDRDIAMVFQNYALYPHLTVEENMGFALKLAKLPKAEIKAKVHEAAETLGLTEYLKRKPGSVRRSAPARGHGPGHCPRAEGLPHGRAAVQPGCQVARADPRGAGQLAAALGHDDRVCHPRPGGGYDHGRPRGGAQDGELQQVARRASFTTPRERIRRRFHRLAGDEYL